MKKPKISLLSQSIILLSTVFISSSATAEAISKGIGVSTGTGYYNFDNELNVEDKNLPSITFTAQATKNLAVQASYGETETRFNGSNNKFDWKYTHIDTVYSFLPHKALRPFVSLGAGEGVMDFGSTDANETLVSAGAGFIYNFTQGLSATTDLRAINSIDNENTSALASVALNYMFDIAKTGEKSSPDFDVSKADTDLDGINDKIDECAGTPKGVDVDVKGCAPDNDLDGIANYQDNCTDTPTNVSVDKLGCPIDLDKDGIADYQDKCPNTTSGSFVDGIGCEMQLGVNNIKFKLDSAQVESQYLKEVQAIAAFMKKYEDTVITVQGHADDSGNTAYNQALSEKRANAIKTVLVKQFGINADRLKIKGFGESSPVATNKSLFGRQENRRAETIITR